jgi:hypothetical protein
MADGNSIQVPLDDEAMERLKTCALWRKVSVEELVRAYVEDWIDVDFPASQGRSIRRGLYRDGPLGLDTNFLASRNWIEELRGKPHKREWSE